MAEIKEYADYQEARKKRNRAAEFAADLLDNGHKLHSVRVVVLKEAPDGERSSSVEFNAGLELAITESFAASARRAIQQLTADQNAKGQAAKKALNDIANEIKGGGGGA